MAITLKRGFEVFSDRYKYDFNLMTYANGWAQIDTRQDASYYGTWTNPERRELFNYCEGDTTLTVCDTEEDYKQAVRECADWNKQAGYWIGIDPGYGTGMMRDKFVDLGLEDLFH